MGFRDYREALIERLTAAAAADQRIAACWLQGSIADGSSDDYSDVDAYVCVYDAAYDEVYGERLSWPERLGGVLARAETAAIRGTHFLMEGPVKLDLLFERRSEASKPQRPAVLMLVDKDAVTDELRSGWQPDERAAAAQVEQRIRGRRQGAAWPVRLLARGQPSTFLYVELFLIHDDLLFMLAAQHDPRLLFKNRFTLARLLPDHHQALLDELTAQTTAAWQSHNLVAMRDAHLAIVDVLERESRAACAALGIAYPDEPGGDAAIRRFFIEEWPEG